MTQEKLHDLYFSASIDSHQIKEDEIGGHEAGKER
jgi:hypothetical protein